jgi:hypothetical protein
MVYDRRGIFNQDGGFIQLMLENRLESSIADHAKGIRPMTGRF